MVILRPKSTLQEIEQKVLLIYALSMSHCINSQNDKMVFFKVCSFSVLLSPPLTLKKFSEMYVLPSLCFFSDKGELKSA